MDRVREYVHQFQPDLIETVRQSVRIQSVKGREEPGAPYGKPIHDALMHALATAGQLGFKTGNVGGHVGWCEYGDGEEMVAVLGHLDVVPAGTGWTDDPFSAELREGKILGRGTMDDKGPLFACLYGLKALVSAGVPLRRRIRILFGTNEESGSADIPHYTASEELPVLAFSPDGEFPVIFAEKGILNVRFSAPAYSDGAEGLQIEQLHGGTAPNAVADTCTVRVRGIDAAALRSLSRTCEALKYRHRIDAGEENTAEITFFGKSAHGSTPHKGVNAASHAIRVLDTLSLRGAAGRWIHFLAEKLGEETDGRSLGIQMEDHTGALTVNLGLLRLENGTLSAALNIRYPVTRHKDEVLVPLEKLAMENHLGFQVLSGEAPLYHDPSEPLVAELLKVYHEFRPGGSPIAIGGGTYAKELPNTVAFGPLFPGRLDLNHQANEYITLEELEELTQIYTRAMEALSNMDI